MRYDGSRGGEKSWDDESEDEETVDEFKSEYREVLTRCRLSKIENHRVVDNIWNETGSVKCRCCSFWPCTEKKQMIVESVCTDFQRMTQEERRYRIKYLWFRVRCVYNMMRFVIVLKTNLKNGEDDRENETNLEMLMEDEEFEQVNKLCGFITWASFIFVWRLLMSFVHWFNLISTPLLLLWPELFLSPSYSLWLNEFCFLLNMVTKCFTKKPKSAATDNYDIFVDYFKSNFILDLIATVPNMFSGMNIVFAPLKLVRIYEIDQLHYTFTHIMYCVKHDKSQSEKNDIEFAFSTICKIFILLHYLCIIWIYIGGAAFLEYEEGHKPWQYADDDFHGMSNYQLYVFSTYWVFTVITTVGYGDYTAGTTLEYQFSVFLQIFGLVTFTAIQITVTRVVNSKYSFRHYIKEREDQIDFWLHKTERRSQPYHYPSELYLTLMNTAKASIKNDFNMIIEEYGFWEKCTAKD